MNEKLSTYVKDARAKGKSDVEITKALLGVGWKQEEIELALNPVTPTPPVLTISSDTGPLRRIFLGRIGRMRYFLGTLILGLPTFLLVTLWGLAGYLQSTSDLKISSYQSLPDMVIPILLLFSVIFYFICYFALSTRRLHDLNMSGWFLLLNFIPLIGSLFGLFMLFAPGSSGVNKYGLPPQTGRGFIEDILNK